MASWSHMVYQWQRHRLAGWSLLRWTMALLFGMGLVLLVLGWGTWGWFAAATAWGTLVALRLAALWASRRRFIRFRPERDREPAPVDAGEGPVAVYVTGWVRVGERGQHVLHAAGQVERFRSGEVAVSVVVRPSRYVGLATLPWEWEGMWYRFLAPKDVTRVQPGHVRYNERWWPALAVEVQDGSHRDVVYLAFADVAPRDGVWHWFTTSRKGSVERTPATP